MKLQQAMIGFLFTLAILAIGLGASIWFQQSYVGLLLEAVPNSVAFKNQWQQHIDQNPTLRHPAIIHVLPENCLCRLFTLKHATAVAQSSTENGFSNVVVGSHSPDIGPTVSLGNEPYNPVSPMVVITSATGKIAYLGAYSDGVRCNTGTSLIENFIANPATLPEQAVIGLDVVSCRCLAE